MADPSADLAEIEAIKRLKYTYLRCLDLKLWDELEGCFSEDATSAYSGGKYSFAGRDAIMAFLRKSMPNTLLTSHRVHHPEITLINAREARGVWALDDVVIETTGDFTISGSAYYTDTYVKVSGVWKIRETGYERIFEQFESRKDRPSLRLTQNRFADGADT